MFVHLLIALHLHSFDNSDQEKTCVNQNIKWNIRTALIRRITFWLKKYNISIKTQSIKIAEQLKRREYILK